MSFAQLHCDGCGCAKNVDTYLHEPGMPTSANDWGKRVESRGGKCKCGGNFTLGARPRCPKCRSLRLDRGDVQMCYD
jgi:hypothetical protein